MRMTSFAVVVAAGTLLAGCSENRATASRMRNPAPAPQAGAGMAQGNSDMRGSGRGGSNARLQREVRHELVMLPYYGVFDNLGYRVNGDRVELFGQVTRPTLKSDAENVVKNIEGVGSVVNNIEVLPLSPSDDQIRLAAYRAIYSAPQLNRYAMAAVPSIHIIVKNGNVTLEGVAASEGDKNIANIQANSVPGVFSVTNNLQIEGK